MEGYKIGVRRLSGGVGKYFWDARIETVVDYGMVLSFWYDPSGEDIDEYLSCATGLN